MLDKLTYAGRRENLEGLDPDRVELVEGDIADPDAVARRARGLRRGRQLRRRVARRPLDRGARASSSRPTSSAPSCCSRRRATAGIRYLQVSTDEVYGSIEAGSFTESSPLDPSSPYSASKAGGDLIVGAYHHTYGADALIVPRLEQLRALPVPREADPALHPERARTATRCRSTATACRSATGSTSRTSARGDRPGAASAARPGEVYNVGGPDELPNIDVVRRILELTGRDESLIEYVTDRPGHDRRYSLASDEDPRRSAGSRRSRFDEGLERTVDWYRDNEWWWEPIRSGEYREYYERQYGTRAGG